MATQMSLTDVIQADLATFVSSGDFGTTATLPGAVEINVIFDQEDVVFEEGFATVSSNRLKLMARYEDVQSLSQGDTIDITDRQLGDPGTTTTYNVDDVREDGTGMAEVIIYK